MATNLTQHHGAHDFKLGELRYFRIHTYGTLAQMNADLANAEGRIAYNTQTQRFYYGRPGAWIGADNSTIYEDPVTTGGDLPISPPPTTGSLRIVTIDPEVNYLANLFMFTGTTDKVPLLRGLVVDSAVSATKVFHLSGSPNLAGVSAGAQFIITSGVNAGTYIIADADDALDQITVLEAVIDDGPVSDPAYAALPQGWQRVTDDIRIIFSDGTRPFIGIPNVANALVQIPVIDEDLTTKKYVDDADAALQAEIDAEEAKVQPILLGGTDATTAQGARTNLDVPGLNTENTFSKAQTIVADATPTNPTIAVLEVRLFDPLVVASYLQTWVDGNGVTVGYVDPNGGTFFIGFMQIAGGLQVDNTTTINGELVLGNQGPTPLNPGALVNSGGKLIFTFDGVVYQELLKMVSPPVSTGDLIVFNGTELVTLPVGANNEQLVADNGTPEGVKWEDRAAIEVAAHDADPGAHTTRNWLTLAQAVSLISTHNTDPSAHQALFDAVIALISGGGTTMTGSPSGLLTTAVVKGPIYYGQPVTNEGASGIFSSTNTIGRVIGVGLAASTLRAIGSANFTFNNGARTITINSGIDMSLIHPGRAYSFVGGGTNGGKFFMVRRKAGNVLTVDDAPTTEVAATYALSEVNANGRVALGGLIAIPTALSKLAATTIVDITVNTGLGEGLIQLDPTADLSTVVPGDRITVAGTPGNNGTFTIERIDPNNVIVTSETETPIVTGAATISLVTFATKQFNFSSTPNLSGVIPGYVMDVTGSTNALNNRRFTLATVNDGLDEVTVVEDVVADTIGAATFANPYATQIPGVDSVGVGTATISSPGLAHDFDTTYTTVGDNDPIPYFFDSTAGNFYSKVTGDLLLGYQIDRYNFFVQDIRGGASSYTEAIVTTSPFNATTENVLLVNATGGARLVNLAPAASRAQKLLFIKKTDATSNGVTVDANGAETIDGATTRTLALQNDFLILYSDGTTWRIFGMTVNGVSGSGGGSSSGAGSTFFFTQIATSSPGFFDATEQTFFNGASVGTRIVPGGFFAPGKILRILVRGNITGTNPPYAIPITVKMGAQTVGTFTFNLTAAATEQFELEFLAVCRSAGVSGQLAIAFKMLHGTGNIAPIFTGASGLVGSFDTTLGGLIDVVGSQPASVSPSPGLTIFELTMEQFLQSNPTIGASALSGNGGGLSGAAFFAQTANSTITVPTVVTSLIGTGIGSNTVPANFFAPGKVLRITQSGRVTAGVIGTATFYVYLDGLPKLTLPNFNLPTGSVGLIWYELTTTITCQSIGVSGTVQIEVSVVMYDATNDLMYSMAHSAITPATVDTTVPFDVEIYGRGSALISLFSVSTVMEQLVVADATVGMVAVVAGSTPAYGFATVTSTPFTITSEDLILVDASAGIKTINLPPASTRTSRTVVVKKIDLTGNDVTVVPNGAQTIDGNASTVLFNTNETYTFFSDGSNWFII